MLLAKSSVVDISPSIATHLGCGPKEIVPPDPNAGLEANILLLHDPASGADLLLISLDSLYPGPRLREQLESGLSRFLLPESIFLASSHTHAAPQLDDTKPLLGSIVEAHFLRISNLLVATITAMFEKPEWEQVSCRLSQYESNSVVHRRRVVPVSPREKSISFFTAEFLPNLRRTKPVGSELMEFMRGDEVYGALWVMPCHPISNPNPAEISADYIGGLRQRYRVKHQKAKSEIPFLFFQGASGDLRPPSFGLMSNKTIKGFLSNIVFGQRFRRFSEQEKKDWVRNLEREMERREYVVRRPDEIPAYELATRRLEISLDTFFESEIPDRKISLHLASIDGLVLLGISGEPTWEFRNELLGGIPTGISLLTVVGCIDDSFGYLVSAKQARWGGYEVEGFLKPFSLQRKKGVDMESLFRESVITFGREFIHDLHCGGFFQTGREKPSGVN